jgi:hypothetical protein
MTTKQLIGEFEAKYQELTATIEAAQARIKAESQVLVSDLFKDFFARHGEKVYAVHWTQYTPYFNDGDECEFRVNDIYLSFTEEGYDDGEGDADIFGREATYREHLAKWEAYEADPRGVYQAYYDDYIAKNGTTRHYYQPKNYGDWTPSYYDKDELLEKISLIENGQDLLAIVKDFEVLRKVIHKIDDRFMEMIYGNHVKVAYFGPDGRLDVEDYEHD